MTGDQDQAEGDTRSAVIDRRCRVQESVPGKGVFAIEPIDAGEWVIMLSPVFDEQPSRHSIQVGEHRHQAYTGETDDFVNHSCMPNARVDTENLRLVAVRPVTAGEEITIDYEASEWDLAEPFKCLCDGQVRVVRGFRHLSAAEQLALAPLVPAWLWERRTVT